MSKGLGCIERMILTFAYDEGGRVNRSKLTKQIGLYFQKGLWTAQQTFDKVKREYEAGEMTQDKYNGLLNILTMIARSRRQRYIVENKLSSTMSRALNSLERKGLIKKTYRHRFVELVKC